jgi:hypothetical protein
MIHIFAPFQRLIIGSCAAIKLIRLSPQRAKSWTDRLELEGGCSVGAVKTVFDRRTADARGRIFQKSEYRSQNSDPMTSIDHLLSPAYVSNAIDTS